MHVCDGASLQPDGRLSIFSQAGVRTPRRVLDSTDLSRVAKLPWPDDTLEFAPTLPRPADMWAHWNLGDRPAQGNVVDVVPWWVSHGEEIPAPDRTLAQAIKGHSSRYRTTRPF
jgi:hypothetical protein